MSKTFFWNLQQMNEVTRHFCWHQNFVTWGLSAPALGLYTCIKWWKNYINSDFKEMFLKLATNDRSDKMFLLTSKFRPQGVVSPCFGIIHMYKSWKKKWPNCAGAEMPNCQNAGYVKQGCGVGHVLRGDFISSTLAGAEPTRCQNVQWQKRTRVQMYMQDL